jgi:hypothetical protein
VQKIGSVNGTILAADDQAGLLKVGLETRLIGDDVLHVLHFIVATNGVRLVPAGHNVVAYGSIMCKRHFG